MGNWSLNTGWLFNAGLTGSTKEINENKLLSGESCLLLATEEKKLQNFFIGGPHNSTFLHTVSISLIKVTI